MRCEAVQEIVLSITQELLEILRGNTDSVGQLCSAGEIKGLEDSYVTEFSHEQLNKVVRVITENVCTKLGLINYVLKVLILMPTILRPGI